VIVVAGKNNIAVHALNELVKLVGTDGVIALPNRSDIGKNSWQQSLRLAAARKGVRQESLETINKEKVDVFLSLEYDRIIRPDLFPTASLYNFHFSCLPKYKGMYTSIWPVLYGEKESAVTLHEIDQGIDTGGIYAQRRFNVSSCDRGRDLYRKYIKNAIELFDSTIDDILSGTLSSEPQSADRASYFSSKSINFSKLKLNLNCTAWELQRQIYAFSFREYQLPSVLGRLIVEIEITDQKSSNKPGMLLTESDDKLTLSTIDYDVVLYLDKLSETLSSLKDCKKEQLPSLLKHIAGVNDRNHKGWSPIIVSAYYGNLEAVEYLLSRGADPNDCNYKGTTALMYAKEFSLKTKDKRVFELLRKHGASPDISDFSGKVLKDYVTSGEAQYLGLY
jgi:methionyl-tRNA formyltransferase